MRNKYFIFILLFVFVLSCPTTSIISSWQGTFTYNAGSGLITYFNLHNDGCMEGEWQDSNVLLGISSGSYSMFNNVISFSLNGTAIYSSFSSDYVLTGNGTMSDTTADGTFEINYVDSDWTDLSGDWTVTRS